MKLAMAELSSRLQVCALNCTDVVKPVLPICHLHVAFWKASNRVNGDEES